MDGLNSSANHPVTELRTLLARSFAEGIADATPRARATMKELAAGCANGVEKAILEHVARLLAHHRDQFTLHIERCVCKRFDDKLACPEDSISHTGIFSADAITLFEELGMLEEFEREQCVGRLREHCRAELMALAPRMRTLLGCDSLPEARNPLFPRVLLRALADAFASLGCDAGARRTAFRVYGPLLDRIIANVYGRINVMLANTVDSAPPQHAFMAMHGRPADTMQSLRHVAA